MTSHNPVRNTRPPIVPEPVVADFFMPSKISINLLFITGIIITFGIVIPPSQIF